MATKTTTKRTARKTTTRKTKCPKCGHGLKVMKFKGEKKGKITCPDCGWRDGQKPSILGLPIEGAGHETPRAEIANYIDTEGMELPEPTKGLSEKKQAEKDKKFVERQKAKQEREAARIFQGTVQATKVLKKRLDAFKNTVAIAYMILDETPGRNVVVYANAYGPNEDDAMPRSSWQAEHYTYPIKEKVVAKKLEEYEEIEDREAWPKWIVPAVATKRTRKTK